MAYYAASQETLGRKILPARHDDGGLTGDNIERPSSNCSTMWPKERIDCAVDYEVDHRSGCFPRQLAQARDGVLGLAHQFAGQLQGKIGMDLQGVRFPKVRTIPVDRTFPMFEDLRDLRNGVP